MKDLMNYNWPGNVRELENALHSACVVCKGNRIPIKRLTSQFILFIFYQILFKYR